MLWLGRDKVGGKHVTSSPLFDTQLESRGASSHLAARNLSSTRNLSGFNQNLRPPTANSVPTRNFLRPTAQTPLNVAVSSSTIPLVLQISEAVVWSTKGLLCQR